MDANLLRNVGLTVSAAAMAGALAIAALTGRPEPAPAEAPPLVAGPITAAAPAVQPAFAPAAAAPAAAAIAPVSFLVRFQGAGPLGRAQALAAQGRETDARRAVETQLNRQAALRGLCFDRFTVGGAEMVLRTCSAIAEPDRSQTSADWLARLRDMPAVAYADLNAAAAPAQPQ